MARVLVVEDDPDLADVLAYLLRQQGHHVVIAWDGGDALGQVRADTPDLVLLDLHLPGRSGFEVCADIRAALPIPILCVSGRADAATRSRARAAGANAFLLKPFNTAELIARTRTLLAARPAG